MSVFIFNTTVTIWTNPQSTCIDKAFSSMCWDMEPTCWFLRNIFDVWEINKIWIKLVLFICTNVNGPVLSYLGLVLLGHRVGGKKRHHEFKEGRNITCNTIGHQGLLLTITYHPIRIKQTPCQTHFSTLQNESFKDEDEDAMIVTCHGLLRTIRLPKSLHWQIDLQHWKINI